MSNSVTKIVFPLSGGSHLQNFDYFVEGVISIPYVSIPLNTLHKAVKTLQKICKVQQHTGYYKVSLIL